MSAILESVLDDERRAACRANDEAMAIGRPIIASQPTIHPVRRTGSLHRIFKRVITIGLYVLREKTLLVAQLWLGDVHARKAPAPSRHHAMPARSERSNSALVAMDELG